MEQAGALDKAKNMQLAYPRIRVNVSGREWEARKEAVAMQPSKTIMIVAVGLALVAGLVAYIPVACAGHSSNALDKYLQAIFGCNESYGGTGTFKQGGEVAPEGLLACKVQAERRYWKDLTRCSMALRSPEKTSETFVSLGPLGKGGASDIRKAPIIHT